MPNGDQAPPVLVYDRIDRNRRRTRALLCVFAGVLLPFFAALLPPITLVALWTVAASEQEAREPLRTLITAGALGLAWALIAVVCAVAIEVSRARGWALARTRAWPVTAAEEPQLWRVVENLCIGAGLPMPTLYVSDQGPANAFSVGTRRGEVALVVTRSLLGLLDRRELQGVIAHELSHIGNEDMRLNTILAALLQTLRLPWQLLNLAGQRLARGCLVLSMAALAFAALGLLSMVVFALGLIGTSEVGSRLRDALATDPEMRMAAAVELGMAVIGFAITAGPAYLLAGGRWLGMAAGRAVLRERELLADADAALLTRDPEGLALALVKLQGASLRGPAWTHSSMTHLLIVRPVGGEDSWWERSVHTHPTLDERIEALVRMGAGHPSDALRRARDELGIKGAIGGGALRPFGPVEPDR